MSTSSGPVELPRTVEGPNIDQSYAEFLRAKRQKKLSRNGDLVNGPSTGAQGHDTTQKLAAACSLAQLPVETILSILQMVSTQCWKVTQNSKEP